MASGIPKGVAAVPHKQLSDCRTSKRVRLKKGTRYYRATGESPVNFDTLRGESMHYCGISCHIRSSLTAEASRSGYSSSTVPANCLLTPAGCQQPSRPVACSREGERSSPHGSGRPEGVWRRHRGRSAEKSSPNASSGRPKCASARASQTGADEKELAVTRCRAVVVLWRLCTVGKVRLQQGSTMVVPCCSLA